MPTVRVWIHLSGIDVTDTHIHALTDMTDCYNPRTCALRECVVLVIKIHYSTCRYTTKTLSSSGGGLVLTCTFQMSDYMQSVIVQGTVYVGGGYVGRDSRNNYIVMVYDTTSGKWATLPPYRACEFAMTVINNQLLLVGGWVPRNTIQELETRE